jgi:hypothetical protein
MKHYLPDMVLFNNAGNAVIAENAGNGSMPSVNSKRFPLYTEERRLRPSFTAITAIPALTAF